MENENDKFVEGKMPEDCKAEDRHEDMMDDESRLGVPSFDESRVIGKLNEKVHRNLPIKYFDKNKREITPEK